MNTPTLLLCCLGAAGFAAGETIVAPGIESVGLFKNGLAVVHASFPVTTAGSYCWETVPHVVHGSFWVESDGEVSVRTTSRVLASTGETEPARGNLQHDLAGKQVEVMLKNTPDKPGPLLRGTVWDVPVAAPARNWNTRYSSLQPNAGNYGWLNVLSGTPAAGQPAVAGSGGFLILEEASGNRRYIAQSTIASLSVTGPFDPQVRRERRPVLVFDVARIPENGATVRVTYLTKGMAWMPAYQVDLSDPDTLNIRQSAVVRNEMADLEHTEIELISGFPNVRFGAVDSPIWPGTGLAAFFQQVNQSATSSNSILSNSFMGQRIDLNNPNRGGGFFALPEVTENGNPSNDIHYQSIGRHDMIAGDSLSLDIASAKAAYKRVIEWVVDDPRDGRGHYHRNQNQADDDSAWDAVRFTNPFAFPMTTASAMVVEDGKFRGQSLSEWVNPGQQTSLRITRALSVRTESSEVEEEGKRETVWVGGNDYRRTSVTGKLVVKNFRATEVTMTIRCGFSGELIEADGEPGKSLRVDGVHGVNPRRELNWTVPVPAGGEKTLEYRYSVLVDS
ncbi:MAG: hypothetical protein ACQCXQ_00470 [Verrucomicrobiales bacterium]|nr:hypothetical protein [Verrucomicrobiota bacterium JB025]